MVPIGSAIQALLVADPTVAALVGARVYPSLMPQGVSKPAVVFQVISDVPQTTFDGDSSTTLVNALLQIDSYGKTYLEAHAVADAVDAVVSALSSPDLSATREVSRDLYDNEAQLHRVSAEYSCWR